MTKTETAFIWILFTISLILTTMIVSRVVMIYGAPESHVAEAPLNLPVR